MTAQNTLMRFYNYVWKAAIPFLRKNNRLSEGFDERILKKNLPISDIWIQSASGGEAYLTWSIIKQLCPKEPINLLLTSNTSQGIEIIDKIIEDNSSNSNKTRITKAYFPFDQPDIMEIAVSSVQPKLMIFMELEIWPGLLSTLKKHGIKTIILNGRLTEKSLKRYMLFPRLWAHLKPDKILAISNEDAKRFETLFPSTHVEVMPNIKFDGIVETKKTDTLNNPLGKIISPDTPSVLLSSVRKEEESDIEKMITAIINKKPHTIIGLIPRHMHRINHWEKALSQIKIPWVKRSCLTHPVENGTVILWDVFGELSLAYEYFGAAFVGGTLAPLGGQNFLEAIRAGIIPVIGPSWENFSWVGNDIINKKLVQIGSNWKEVVRLLIENLNLPVSREEVKDAYMAYIETRKGSAAHSCELIINELKQ